MKLPLDLPDTDWRPVVEAWAASPVGQKLQAYLAERAAAGATIYPPEPLRALRLTPLSATRVVILGQDPYHGPGQAEGLSFSVPEGVPFPPSLRNIFMEIQRDLGKPFPPNGSLVRWAEAGTLLLNAVLTVEDGQAASHAGTAAKGAASAAGEEARLGKAQVKSELADSALAGIAALEQAGAASREQVDALMDKGRDLVDSAADLIRERPLASFGVAFATGWIIAKLARSK